MTREEAINDLKDFIDTYLTCHGEEDTIAVSLNNVDVEAFHMAIKALEQEPCEDAVSRQAVLDTLDKMDSVLDEDRTVETYKELLAACYNDLPSVTPTRKKQFRISLTSVENVESRDGFLVASDCQKKKRKLIGFVQIMAVNANVVGRM